MRSLLKPLAAALLILGAGGPAAAGDDHERALSALAEGEVLPLTAILARAGELLDGRMIEAELEREHGLWVYEIKLLQRNGRLVETVFDARTAEILSVEGAALEDVLRRPE
ncbi:MAG: PepSY domain-containing protein [Gammaproteobacteria bacterium]|jgi:uncharacterized membrane protein YkoI